MKKILVLLICLGILMNSTLTIFADDETHPFSQSQITHNI